MNLLYKFVFVHESLTQEYGLLLSFRLERRWGYNAKQKLYVIHHINPQTGELVQCPTKVFHNPKQSCAYCRQTRWKDEFNVLTDLEVDEYSKSGLISKELKRYVARMRV